ncbi:Fc receptor-like protein 3 isoform X2 [Erinaceus europaeus]|uniref:Fc receptor-like protein 3 isoform X2 n=1 Tax=Erinaceus europaeus TaxID=9365 RepID=A0ABM3Y8L3_ERIEU|nr:Fc receptor-like protein 3 isoform X2 [Erinaceus europaeus]
MLLWLLLLLAPGGEQSGVVPKALLLLDPPWSTAFKGEKITLTCSDSLSPAPAVFWYHNKTPILEKASRLQITQSGSYECKTQGSSLSDPVHVEFLSDWLILQVSYPVFEGDQVVLRCRGKKENEIKRKIYFKDGEQLSVSDSDLILNSVFRDSSTYHCTASGATVLIPWNTISTPQKIKIKELFPPPLLTVNPSQPIEDSPVTLKCETHLPPQRLHIQFWFRFFRDSRVLGSGWNNSPELHVPMMQTGDSGSYECEAKTTTNNVMKRSLRSQIHVQRVPVSDVTLEIQPPEGQLLEGGNMTLICSVAKGTGMITFSWHREEREGTVRSLEIKTQHSLSAELQIHTGKEHDAGRYYCAAANIQGPILSEWKRVTVRIPVSEPVLTLRTPRAQAMVGDMVELHCEALRGSPPILYWLYHENVTLGHSSASSRRGMSFNFSLTAEHLGNYSCEADNGFGPQPSEVVTLSIIGPSKGKMALITSKATGGLLSILAFAGIVLLVHYFRMKRKTVSPGDTNLVYSQIWDLQPTKENPAKRPQKYKEPAVIYSELRQIRTYDTVEQSSSGSMAHGNATENYENVLCA